MQTRTEKELKIIEQIFTAEPTSLDSELLAVSCAQNPDVLPRSRAAELYIKNAQNGSSDIAQAALWCLISGRQAKISEEFMDMYSVITSSGLIWKDRLDVLEKIAEKAAVAQFTAPSLELLRRMKDYVDSNKTLNASKNSKVKHRIQEILSDLLANQHQLYNGDNPGERFANSLRAAAASNSDQFEILTEAYSLSHEPTQKEYNFLNEDVLEVGRALTSDKDWSERISLAERTLHDLESATLNSSDTAYLRNAIAYVGRHAIDDPAVHENAEALQYRIDTLLEQVTPQKKSNKRLTDSFLGRLPMYKPKLLGTGEESTAPLPQKRLPAPRPQNNLLEAAKAIDTGRPLVYKDEDVQALPAEQSPESTTIEEPAHEPIPVVDYTQPQEPKQTKLPNPKDISPMQLLSDEDLLSVLSSTGVDVGVSETIDMPTTHLKNPIDESPGLSENLDRIFSREASQEQATKANPEFMTWEDAAKYGFTYLPDRVVQPVEIHEEDIFSKFERTQKSTDGAVPLTQVKKGPQAPASRSSQVIYEDADPISLTKLAREHSGVHILTKDDEFGDFLRDYSYSGIIPLRPAKRGFRKTLFGGVAALSLFASIGLIAWASSDTPNRAEEYTCGVPGKPACVVLEEPKPAVKHKEPEKPPAEPTEEERAEMDRQYCKQQLFGPEYYDEKKEVPAGTAVLARVHRSKLPTIAEACSTAQARALVDENFMKGDGVKVVPNKDTNATYRLSNVYMTTIMVEYQAGEGVVETMPVTITDPLVVSKKMSAWGAGRSCKKIPIYSNSSTAPEETKDSTEGPIQDKSEVKDDNDMGAGPEGNAKVVDATHIKPLPSLESAVSSNKPAPAKGNAANPGSSTGYTSSSTAIPKPAVAKTPVPSTSDISDVVSGGKKSDKDSKPAATETSTGNTEYSKKSSTAKRTFKRRKPKGYKIVCSRRHGGEDYVNFNLSWKNLAEKTPIYAPLPGRIRMIVKGSPKAGNWVQTEHTLPNGKTILFEYMHSTFPNWIENLYRQNSTGGIAKWKSGRGPAVYPYVFEGTVVSTTSADGQLSEEQKRLYEGYGKPISFVGHTGNADPGAEHLHLQFKVGSTAKDASLKNPAFVMPVVHKGLGLKWAQEYADILDKMAGAFTDDSYFSHFLQAIRSHESDNMTAVSSANARGFMQLKENGADWAGKHCTVRKNQVSGELSILESLLREKQEKGETDEALEKRIKKLNSRHKRLAYFSTVLTENGSWKTVSHNPFANMFAGASVAHANYVFFGGTKYKEALKNAYEGALKSIKEGKTTRVAIIDELESGRYKVKINRSFTEDYGSILSRTFQRQVEVSSGSDNAAILQEAYKNALEEMRIEMFRRTASGYNRGHYGTLKEIKHAADVDEAYQKQLKEIAKTGEAEKYRQVQQQRLRAPHWLSKASERRQTYVSEVLEEMVFMHSYDTNYLAEESGSDDEETIDYTVDAKNFKKIPNSARL